MIVGVLIGACWGPNILNISFYSHGICPKCLGTGRATFVNSYFRCSLDPKCQTILAKTSPHRIMGEVFSRNQSFQVVGNVVDPQIGSTVTSFLGYRGVFLSTAFLVLINLFSVFKQTKSFYQ